ncbi:MAG: PSD1 and planctomycete cytochrome C domain-containing protein [Pirellulaceae bacterium]
MPRLLATLLVLATWNAAHGAAPKAATSRPLIEFTRDIRPILSDKCIACHGPDEKQRKAKLRLDNEASAKESVIVPGDVNASELIARITSTDKELQMPPPGSGKTLSDKEISLLKRWIKSGAQYAPHWAYVAPKRSSPALIKNTGWSMHWIDRFVLARMEAAGEQPAEDADRITLLRRVYFDLIGLPPTPGEVERFLRDKSKEALATVVDRLLSSERFGERMAMYWLDLIRFADTVGYHGDQDHAISPYRDYVIDAFNRNLAFDQFTREQLAGDLLPNATVNQKIATGYNRLLQTSHEGGVQTKEYLAIYAADRVRNFSNVWLGATMGCCQCHDHKYDPYTLKDFYSLVAFFADVDEAQHFKLGSNALPTRRPPEITVLSRQQRAAEAKLLAQIESSGKDPGESSRRKQLKSELATLRKLARPSMITVSIKPREIRLLPRGDWLDDSGPIMSPAVPEFLGQIHTGGQRATRLDLANWLVDPKKGAGGLTARVLANRIWYLLMGAGISRSLDDFGGQGEPPTHPQLLDALALELLDHGWDLKHLVREIVLTRTYRQSSRTTTEQLNKDPGNRLFARQSRFRLPAEMVRDNALAVSGLLVNQLGGISIRPYQPAGYYRHLNFPKRTYKSDTNRNQWRRGVYMHWQRQFLHPMLRAFDAPSREECTAQRAHSNTPLAAMALLNDPTFIEAARSLALRVMQEGGDTDSARLVHAFRLTLSRSPTQFESSTLLQLLDQSRRRYEESPQEADRVTKVGLARQKIAAHLKTTEIAAWTTISRVLLNLSETITRN